MSVIDFIERLRAKPAQVRKQVALGTAAGTTALVALVWVTAFAASGALSRSAPERQDEGVASAFAPERGASLLGAIGAVMTREEGSVTVVGTNATSTVVKERLEERTVIPF